MSTHTMINWADLAGTEMCRVFMRYRSEQDPATRMELLEELRIAVSSLQAITERLMDLEFMIN